MSIFKDFFVKEKPVFTGITRGLGGFGFGTATAVAESAGGTGGMTASGGIISDYEDSGTYYRSHIFTTAGAFNVTALATDASLPDTVDIFLVGGAGGGGAGVNSGNGNAGTANTGGGAGAGRAAGALGGSGVVVFRMPTAAYSGLISGSPTVSTSSDDTILKFTGSGGYFHGTRGTAEYLVIAGAVSYTHLTLPTNREV